MFPRALSLLTFPQTFHMWKGAAQPPVQHHSLSLREAPQEARRKQWRWKRLKSPRATKNISTALHAKWRSILAPSWRLIVAVGSSSLCFLPFQSFYSLLIILFNILFFRSDWYWLNQALSTSRCWTVRIPASHNVGSRWHHHPDPPVELSSEWAAKPDQQDQLV